MFEIGLFLFNCSLWTGEIEIEMLSDVNAVCGMCLRSRLQLVTLSYPSGHLIQRTIGRPKLKVKGCVQTGL